MIKFTTNRFKPGKPYKGDYTVHAEDGTEANVADLIKGRPAIIDLWASWCKPCRIHSKELIPIYEKYSPLGLAYVAVARERGNTKAMKKAMEVDGYPWMSFVDLDDKDGVWKKNGCDNSGGRILLIDSEGKIVAINPSFETVEKYLQDAFRDE